MKLILAGEEARSRAGPFGPGWDREEFGSRDPPHAAPVEGRAALACPAFPLERSLCRSPTEEPEEPRRDWRGLRQAGGSKGSLSRLQLSLPEESVLALQN